MLKVIKYRESGKAIPLGMKLNTMGQAKPER
jgi:hypothetical protein